MSFWISALALMALALGWIAVVVLRQRGGSVAAAPGGDLAIYRDQLSEIERDLGRGQVAGPEALRLRMEIERRLLDADRAAGLRLPAGMASSAANRWLGLGGLVLAGAVVALYLHLGAPLYPDQSRADRVSASEALRANRPTQADAEAAVAAEIEAAKPTLDAESESQIARLRSAMLTRPSDLTGQEMLAQYEAASGNYAAAAQAQARVVALKAGAATAADYAVLANLLILATGGLVTADAEQALTEALRRDPANGPARYYSGLLFAQIDRPDLAYRLWRPLFDDSAKDAPWMAALGRQLDLVAEAAGVDYRVPVAEVKGPDQGDIAAAAEMSADDRNAMIAGMVERLSSRLASGGGTAAEWAQLIAAYGVLGDRDRAAAAWAMAQQQFDGAPGDLAAIRAAAAQAGVAP